MNNNKYKELENKVAVVIGGNIFCSSLCGTYVLKGVKVAVLELNKYAADAVTRSISTKERFYP